MMDASQRMPTSYDHRNSWGECERAAWLAPKSTTGCARVWVQAGVTVESARLALVHSCELSSCCGNPCRPSYHDFDKLAAMDMRVLAGSANIVTITK